MLIPNMLEYLIFRKNFNFRFSDLHLKIPTYNSTTAITEFV